MSKNSSAIDKLLQQRMDLHASEVKSTPGNDAMQKATNADVEKELQEWSDKRGLGQPVLLVTKARTLSSGYRSVEALSCDLLFTILSISDPIKYNLTKWTEILGKTQKSSHAHKTAILAEFGTSIGVNDNDPLPCREVLALIKVFVNKFDEKHGKPPSQAAPATGPAPTMDGNALATPAKQPQATAVVTMTKNGGGSKKKRILVPDTFNELQAIIKQAFGVTGIKDIEDSDGCEIENDGDVMAMLETSGVAVQCVEDVFGANTKAPPPP